jgi:bacteriocin-like protein
MRIQSFTNLELNAKELQEIKGGKRVYPANIQTLLANAISVGNPLPKIPANCIIKTTEINCIKIEWCSKK